MEQTGRESERPVGGVWLLDESRYLTVSAVSHPADDKTVISLKSSNGVQQPSFVLHEHVNVKPGEHVIDRRMVTLVREDVRA